MALGSQILVEFQAGEALNDITGVAFILAAVALLVNGYAALRPARGPSTPDRPRSPAARSRRRGAGRRRASRPGLAAGTKLSFLAPVAALTVAVIVIAPRTTRLRAAALWGIPMLAAGGYWYVRNLVAVGNPIPYIGSLGPDLAARPGPRLPASARLRRRPLLERHGACGGTGSRPACTSRSGPSGR